MGYALCAVFEVYGSGWELSGVLEVNGKEVYPAPLLSSDVQPLKPLLGKELRQSFGVRGRCGRVGRHSVANGGGPDGSGRLRGTLVGFANTFGFHPSFLIAKQ
ncbi:hypothetical protein ACFX2J_002399 [Malus domestica]